MRTVGAPGSNSRYASKLKTARDALSKIRSGSRVFLGSGCAEPQHLLNTLVELSGQLQDVEIVHMLTVGTARHVARRFDRNFRHNSFFVGPGVRDAVAEGWADYTPIFLSQIPPLIKKGRMHLDVALVQVSPPDKHGFCSFGVSVEAHHAAVEVAEYVVAQVNPQMPRTLGDSFVHIDKFDAIVEFEEPILEVFPPEADETAEQIAKQISRLVEDGSTLQMGIGVIPNAVLRYLMDKKDLGIHTEMFSDGLIDLIEAGVVTNARKTFHPGKVLAAFCIGTRRLYDYIDSNPMFEFHPTDYNSSPINIARNYKMVAINTALEVDITGQVCADSIGHRIYSGIGGQADFIRGAALAQDGKPIIALPSTARNGTISRITAELQPGAGVVTTRGDVHYVATEFGVAYLHGKTLRERALALISIAHPKFRDQLMAKAKEFNYVYKTYAVPENLGYPVEIEHEHQVDGMTVLIRPVKASDERLLQEYLYDLSERSIYLRFFQRLKAFHYELAHEMVNVDYRERMGIIATIGTADAERIIAAAHWILDVNKNMAEAAFSVADEYQHHGLGHYLGHLLVRLAKERGIRGFTAETLSENIPMRRIFEHLAAENGTTLHSDYDNGVISIWFAFADRTTQRQETQEYGGPPASPASYWTL